MRISWSLQTMVSLLFLFSTSAGSSIGFFMSYESFLDVRKNWELTTNFKRAPISFARSYSCVTRSSVKNGITKLEILNSKCKQQRVRVSFIGIFGASFYLLASICLKCKRTHFSISIDIISAFGKWTPYSYPTRSGLFSSALFFRISLKLRIWFIKIRSSQRSSKFPLLQYDYILV